MLLLWVRFCHLWAELSGYRALVRAHRFAVVRAVRRVPSPAIARRLAPLLAPDDMSSDESQAGLPPGALSDSELPAMLDDETRKLQGAPEIPCASL